MPVNPNNPNFVRSNTGGSSPGYHTRTIFTFSPAEVVSTVGDWVSDSNWDGLNELLGLYPNYCHGTNVFPIGYWQNGRQIRIKGTAIVSDDGGGVDFNMRFSIYESGDADYNLIAVQNGGANHSFADGGTAIDVPVDFECTIGHFGSTFLFGSGYYQYNYLDYNGTGRNRNSNARVPLWEYTGTNGQTSINLGSFNTTTLIFNFFGSNVVSISLLNFRIEEFI